MKNITMKEFKEIIKESGISYDCDLGAVLNTISILYDRSADFYKIEDVVNMNSDNKGIIEVHKNRSRRIYDCLDKLGYYDDVKNK